MPAVSVCISLASVRSDLARITGTDRSDGCRGGSTCGLTLSIVDHLFGPTHRNTTDAHYKSYILHYPVCPPPVGSMAWRVHSPDQTRNASPPLSRGVHRGQPCRLSDECYLPTVLSAIVGAFVFLSISRRVLRYAGWQAANADAGDNISCRYAFLSLALLPSLVPARSTNLVRANRMRCAWAVCRRLHPPCVAGVRLCRRRSCSSGATAHTARERKLL